MFKNAARKEQRRHDTITAMPIPTPMVPLNPMAMPSSSKEGPTITLEEIVNDWDSGSQKLTDLSIAFVKAVSKLDEPNSEIDEKLEVI